MFQLQTTIEGTTMNKDEFAVVTPGMMLKEEFLVELYEKESVQQGCGC